MLVYVASPYSAPDEAGRIANVEAAMTAAAGIFARGHVPVIPHLIHYYDLWVERETGVRHPGEFYMQWDFALLRRCDALLYLAPSPGADRELALAQELGLFVFRSVAAVPVNLEAA